MSALCDCKEPRYCICDLEHEREAGALEEREKIAAWLRGLRFSPRGTGLLAERIRNGEHNELQNVG